MSSIFLNGEALDRARAVVARECASPQQEKRFAVTYWTMGSTFILFGVWILVTISAAYRYQQYILILTGFAAATALILFSLNLGFIRSVVVATFVAHRMGLRGKNRARPSRLVTSLAPFAALAVVGVVVIWLGLNGIVEEFEQRDWTDLVFAGFVAALGLCCVSLWPLEWARRRIREIIALREALAEVRNGSTAPTEIAAAAFDRITDLEFEQTLLDSKESLRKVGVGEAERTVAVRFGPQFQRAISLTSDLEAGRVYDLIGALTSGASDQEGDHDVEATLAVAGTKLQIRFRHHSQLRQIEVISLEPSGK